MLKELRVLTKNRYQLIDITNQIEEMVEKSKIISGVVFLFVPHSTSALILTENESRLKQDWVSFFKKTVSGLSFLHNQIDNNGDSHILSGLLGQDKALIIENGRIIRGTWQQIFLVELDGPRERRILLKFIKY